MNLNNDAYMVSSAGFSRKYARSDGHVHIDYEIIFVTNGILNMQINDKLYQVAKNNIVLITNLENHKVISTSKDYNRYCITLRPSITDRYLRNPSLISILKNHSADFTHCIDVSEKQDKVTALFENLICNDADHYFANDLAMAYLIELLTIIYQASDLPITLSEIETKTFILKIQTYLDKHFFDDIRISDVCKKFCISTCYLSHKFREITGLSPKQYLTHIRLHHAAALLCDTKIPIGEIAFQCGFQDVNNFIKIFKREYDCLPSEYRKSYCEQPYHR